MHCIYMCLDVVMSFDYNPATGQLTSGALDGSVLLWDLTGPDSPLTDASTSSSIRGVCISDDDVYMMQE